MTLDQFYSFINIPLSKFFQDYLNRESERNSERLRREVTGGLD